ncbi:MAG: AAA family ATPase [Spirochaetes bacterium]|nr:AAA family ATPase [Spirochaetota bacterium]
MHLKSFELFGFKSFADKTQIMIEPGITAIIGPNGCGKSNIVDSVKWVLGEKQAKNIRGEKMEDIIFNGTDQRKPLSVAEVSITIDNSNKILDIDTEAVKVSRRIFRDGESEYLINKSPVRLKDIEKLFMDTGIGKTSYSVMEQGKIDMILSTRAEDRRYLFEEAAGVSRYKLQRKESEKKLQSTGTNLSRISDIIKEIERERDVKSGQASKTKEYISLRKRLIDLDIRIHLIDYFDFNKRRDKLKEEIQNLNQENEKISARVSKISTEEEKDEKLKNDIQLRLFELDKELHTFRIKIENIDSKTENNRKLIKEQYLRKESILKKIDERTKNLDKLNEEKNNSETQRVEVIKKLEQDNNKLRDYIKSREEKVVSINNAKNKIAENKKEIKSEEAKLEELREFLEVIIKKLLDAIEKRKAELSGSEEERQKVKVKIADHLSSLSSNISRSVDMLNAGRYIEAAELLNNIDIEMLKSDIKIFEDFEDGFRTILFDKTGIHAEKESLDSQINGKVVRIGELQSEIIMLEESLVKWDSELEELKNGIAKIEKEIIRNENEQNWIVRHLENLSQQIEDLAGQIENHKEDILASEKVTENLVSEIKEWGNLLIEYNEKSELLKRSINEQTDKRSEIEREIFKRKDISRKDIENQKRIIEKISSKEKNQVEFDFKISNIEEYLWTEYEKKIPDINEIKVDETERSDFQNAINGLKKEINDLGPINNLAIEEYKELSRRLDYYIKQRDDIEKARKDIISVIEDINKTSIEIFTETFHIIRKNFSEIFKKLFQGGDASIELTDEENILESGIEIIAMPPGKKPKNINILSGGERTLTAIALLFATYMVRPSPFCFLDEIDAALDEENIGRFLRMLEQFAKSTQFIIITHNKKTISIAESIYGITMEEPGVSKIVSYRMEKSEGKAVLTS